FKRLWSTEKKSCKEENNGVLGRKRARPLLRSRSCEPSGSVTPKAIRPRIVSGSRPQPRCWLKLFPDDCCLPAERSMSEEALAGESSYASLLKCPIGHNIEWGNRRASSPRQ